MHNEKQNKLEKVTNYPDAKKHFAMSIIKSVVRLLACTYLCFGDYQMAAAGLAVAEFIGIGEELV
jgi:hypothetical protein